MCFSVRLFRTACVECNDFLVILRTIYYQYEVVGIVEHCWAELPVVLSLLSNHINPVISGNQLPPRAGSQIHRRHRVENAQTESKCCALVNTSSGFSLFGVPRQLASQLAVSDSDIWSFQPSRSWLLKIAFVNLAPTIWRVDTAQSAQRRHNLRNHSAQSKFAGTA